MASRRRADEGQTGLSPSAGGSEIESERFTPLCSGLQPSKLHLPATKKYIHHTNQALTAVAIITVRTFQISVSPYKPCRPCTSSHGRHVGIADDRK
jgi:hypothetical protein